MDLQNAELSHIFREGGMQADIVFHPIYYRKFLLNLPPNTFMVNHRNMSFSVQEARQNIDVYPNSFLQNTKGLQLGDVVEF
jgi:hypothetical protein